MIPYIEIPPLQLGFVSIHFFGIMASLAVASGIVYVYRLAEAQYGAGRTLLDMAPYFLIAGFGCAHLAAMLFYSPKVIHGDQLSSLINMVVGLSSFGGLIGGTFGVYVFIKRHGLPFLPWLDILARGFSLSYIFGRAGCSVAHDHPGKLTDFFLAVDYPSLGNQPAAPRHDLGLYEFFLWSIIFILFHVLGKKQRPDGFFTSLLILIYSPIRFGLDFLRINDTTYSGLTFAQWCCVVVLPIGIFIVLRIFINPVYSRAIGIENKNKK